MQEAWLSRNAQFYQNKKAITPIGSRMAADPTTIVQNISTMKPTDLLRLKKMAAQDSDFAPLWTELQSGYKDALVNQSTVNGELDISKLAKLWAKPEQSGGLSRRILLGEDSEKAITDALDAHAVAIGGNEASTKAAKQAAAIEGKSWSTLSKLTLSDKIANIGAARSSDQETLAQLDLLDKILGNTPEGGFVRQAQDMYDAKRLGVDANGKLPITPQQKGGKSLYGLELGGALAAAGGVAATMLLHGNPIAAGGALLGAGGLLASAYLQSPSGAALAYRLLNKIRSGVPKIASGIGGVTGGSLGASGIYGALNNNAGR
jgi:hypothetical protein